MPRQIDLFPKNLQVSNNPLNQLAMTTGQLTNMISELTNLPALELEAIEQFITQLLTYIDQATGLDLLPFWQAVENSLSSLTTLFGQLNPLSGSFDPLGAVITFLQLVVTYSASLPSTLVTDLSDIWGVVGALPQEIIDTIVGALGGSGTGNPVSAITSLLEDIPQGNISGLVTDLANAGSSLVQDLQDTIVNALGVIGTGNPLSEVEAALSNIPHVNVSGIFGNSNIGDALQQTANSILQGLTNTVDSVFGVAQVANAASVTSTAASNALTAAQNTSTAMAQRAVTVPGFHGIDPTVNAVFDITSLTGTAPTYVNCTAGATLIGFLSTRDGGIKESVVWKGQGNTNISSLVLNIYKVNTTTGALTNVHTSTNQTALIGSSLGWSYYNMPSAGWITTAPGDWYAVEMQIAGTGTHQVVGMPNHWMLPNPNTFPKQLGAVRTPGPATGITIDHGQGFGGTGSISSGSWSAPIASGASAVYVILNAVSSATATCTVAGTSMTLVQSISYSGGYLHVFVLYSPPSGTQTIAFTTGTAAFTSAVSVSVFGSVAFTDTISTASGSGTSLSQSVTGASGQMVLQVFAQSSGSGNLTGYSQTSVVNVNGVNAQHNPIVVGYVTGTGSASSFTATSSASAAWEGIAIPLLAPITSPSSITSPTYSSNVPWFGLGGSAGISLHAPETTHYSTEGSFTYTVPAWFRSGIDYLDVVAIGGGGGGDSGTGGPGTAGTNTTVTVGGTTLTAAAGAGGNDGGALTTSDYLGKSPGNETYQGTTYFGGGQAGPQAPGNAPGGGGGGGAQSVGFTTYHGQGGYAASWATGTYQPTGTTVSVVVGTHGPGQTTYSAGPGAPGAVWIVARQNI